MLKFVSKLRDFCRDEKPYSGLIEIDHEKLTAFSQELSQRYVKGELKVPDWRRPGVYPEADHVFANHSFWHSVVNFCYLDPANPKQKFQVGQFSGAEAMCHCFTRKFDDNLISSDDVLEIAKSHESVEEFFRGDVSIPLIEERRGNLLEAALVVKKIFKGYPENILYECNFRTDLVVKCLLTDFPISFGLDWVGIDGKILVFAKRAQLWPLVYQGRAMNSENLRWLLSYEKIGPIVDYQVPNGLRHRGIHRYAKELAEKIDNKVPLERQSREELAVRFATAETLLDLQDVTRLTQVELDFPLWWEGRVAYKNGLQHMLVKTTDY